MRRLTETTHIRKFPMHLDFQNKLYKFRTWVSCHISLPSVNIFPGLSSYYTLAFPPVLISHLIFFPNRQVWACIAHFLFQVEDVTLVYRCVGRQALALFFLSICLFPEEEAANSSIKWLFRQHRCQCVIGN